MNESESDIEHTTGQRLDSTRLLSGLFCKGEVDEIYERAEKEKSKAFLKGWAWGAMAGVMLMRWVLPLFG